MDHDDIHQDEHDQGLAYDLATMGGRHRAILAAGPTLMTRRGALRTLGGFGGLGLLAVAGCGSGTSKVAGSGSAVSTAPAGGAGTAAAAGTSKCTLIPTETGGPFPADGSNDLNVLNQTGVVRRDITSSFGSSTTTAQGVPLTIVLALKSQAEGCAAYSGAAVYVWHCDREARYSLYDEGVTQENYLRGVQEAGSDGTVTFKTIYPGAYPGRWPHIHFEVFETLAKAAAGAKLRTSQLALPEAANKLVYATTGYEQSVANLARTSLASDNFFRDGSALQVPTFTGDVRSGFTMTLDVVV